MRILNAKFGWRRNIPPELELEPGDRRNLREHFAQRRGRLFWNAAAIGIVFVVAWFIWLFHLEVAIFGRRIYGWYKLALMVCWLVTAQATIGYVLRNDHARLVRTILRELGHDVCVRCGYLQRGLGENVTQCPECGEDRESIGQNHHAD